MLLSDIIACAIEDLLNEGRGTVELRRGELAARLGCVPSQINYVLASRFTPERGYTVESRRGGGGYIRIVRCPLDQNTVLMHFLQSIGDAADKDTASAFLRALYDNDLLSLRELRLVAPLLSLADTSRTRADMLRRLVLEILKSDTSHN